jgi:hypothetical protein
MSVVRGRNAGRQTGITACIVRRLNIPALNYARLVLVPENANGRRIQAEQLAVFRRKVKPAGSEDTQNVAVSEERRVAFTAQGAIDYIQRARPDLRYSFPVRHAVAKQGPAGPTGPNLFSGSTFVIAVIPLHEVGIDLGLGSEPGQFTGAARPGERTRENQFEGMAGEQLADAARFLLSFGRERKIGPPRMRSGKAPFRFAMPDYPDVHPQKVIFAENCIWRGPYSPLVEVEEVGARNVGLGTMQPFVPAAIAVEQAPLPTAEYVNAVVFNEKMLV